MISIEELKKCVSSGLEYVKSQDDVKDAEVFASWYDNITVRLNYTSEIPCNGVHEPKNVIGYGIGIFCAFKNEEAVKIGYGSETADLTLDGVKTALQKARLNAVYDPHYISIPMPSKSKPRLISYDNVSIMNITDEEIVELGWKALTGAIMKFKEGGYTRSIVVGGDVNILKEKMAVANTNGIYDYDESTYLTTSITAMIEDENTKGTGWNNSTHLHKFNPDEAGMMAAESAINSIGGKRIRSNKYNVIFGPQAVAMLFSEMIISALSLNYIDSGKSPYVGKFGDQVANKNLNIYDDASMINGIATKKITCEGVPTAKTELIREGRLVGFLTNHYYAKKLETNIVKFPPNNGFKFGRGGGRDFKKRNSIFATNFVIEGKKEMDKDELLKKIKNGIYIGRLWYLYPVYGLAKADFTGTIIGDSYVIENGKISHSVKPNTVRINGNFVTLLQSVVGISVDKKPTQLWDAEEVVVAPEIAVRGINLENVADFIEEL